MKTSYAILAIVASTLFTQSATAKLGASPAILQLASNMEINVEAEIIDNINEMLANVNASTIKDDVTKQLTIGTVQSQTNELMQSVNENLPEFKFKVVIAD
ncbi:hypothetical protein [uncultured Paraglaciecola sp.]|uniref:hypothetical protein n=1 Tax=uncultured Paraglaciecola sp. TaxID=1765024 RepID=UPI0030D798A6|tara:strand:+ start:53360 stop:53662 length:303 start_codon:yes stop_codon:yes gene_type:complete